MSNVANDKEKFVLPEGYVPLGSGAKKLEVPNKEGYHRRWFRGEPGRIHAALKAGYNFVDPSEVGLNNFDLGGDAKSDGNTDLGTRVSVVSGEGMDSSGQPARLYLMECRQELYEYSRSLQADRNEGIAEALRGGQVGAGGESNSERAKRYSKTGAPDLFTPKTKRS